MKILFILRLKTTPIFYWRQPENIISLASDRGIFEVITLTFWKSVTRGIFFDAATRLNLDEYSDANWTHNRGCYMSTWAQIVYLRKQPILLASRKQKNVMLSSTEAEYVFLCCRHVNITLIDSVSGERTLCPTPLDSCDLLW